VYWVNGEKRHHQMPNQISHCLKNLKKKCTHYHGLYFLRWEITAGRDHVIPNNRRLGRIQEIILLHPGTVTINKKLPGSLDLWPRKAAMVQSLNTFLNAELELD